MNQTIDGATIRRVLLEVLREFDTPGPEMQSGTVLHEVAKRLGFLRDIPSQKVLLTLWHDLYRSGHLSWGFNISEPNLPFCHLTENGRKALENFSRDPMNPDGYLAHLRTKVHMNSIATSYIEEALRTYNANCYKATAVMVGCASEATILELRDTLVAKLSNLGRLVPKNLQDWKIKSVLNSLRSELDKQSNNMPTKLKDSFEAYWSAFIQQIRGARNDVGHPSSIDPVTPETVHASLLIFPELAELSKNLHDWISSSYR